MRKLQLHAVGPGAGAEGFDEAHARVFAHRVDAQGFEEVLVGLLVVSTHDGHPSGAGVGTVVLGIALELVADEVLVVGVFLLQQQRGGERFGGHGVLRVQRQSGACGGLRLGEIPQPQVQAGDHGVAEVAVGVQVHRCLGLLQRGFAGGGLAVLGIGIQRERQHAAGKGVLRLQRHGTARCIH